MINLPRICTAVTLGSTLAAGVASAGLNSAATAKMYWQSGSTGTALAQRRSTDAHCQLLVTCKGISNLRGADVQIQVNAIDGGVLPAAWQAQTGGCADGAFILTVGGRGGSIYANAFNASPAIPGLFVPQNQEYYDTGDCKTPHGVGLLWLSAAGAAGEVRNPSQEYAIWSISFDLTALDQASGLPCGGGMADPNGVRGVCLNPNLRLPCTDTQRGGVLELLDGNLDVDFASFLAGKQFLTWQGPINLCCPGCISAVPGRTWGMIKRLYQ